MTKRAEESQGKLAHVKKKPYDPATEFPSNPGELQEFYDAAFHDGLEQGRKDATGLFSLKEFCEKHGYGLVMQWAVQWWKEKDPTGALTVGPTVRAANEPPKLKDMEWQKPEPSIWASGDYAIRVEKEPTWSTTLFLSDGVIGFYPHEKEARHAAQQHRDEFFAWCWGQRE